MKRKIRSTFRKRHNQPGRRQHFGGINWRQRQHTAPDACETAQRAVWKRNERIKARSWAALRGGWGPEARKAEIEHWWVNCWVTTPVAATLF